MFDRIMRAITFKTDVYPEVSKDETFTTSAWLIVAVVTFLSQIGSRVSLVSGKGFVTYILAIVVGTLLSLGGFALGVFIMTWLAKALFSVQLTFNQLMRPVALANVFQIVGVLSIFGVVLTCIASPIIIIAAVAGFIAYLFAIKKTTELDWGKVAVLVIAAFVVSLIVTSIVGAIFAVPAALSSLAQ